MEWDWVRRDSKQRDLQNRLDFTLSMARKLARLDYRPEAASTLEAEEQQLRSSLLMKEGTYCNERLKTGRYSEKGCFWASGERSGAARRSK